MGGICPAADQSTDEGKLFMANRVVINICGEELTFIAEESSSYMQRVGAYVNDKMAEVLDSSKVGRTDAAVLTAVNIADELFKAQAAAEQLRGQIKGYLDEAGRAQSEASELKRRSSASSRSWTPRPGRTGDEAGAAGPRRFAGGSAGGGPERRGRGVPGLGRLQRP